MCSFKIPHKLYGIHMDNALTETRKCFIEYIETLPHIKKYSKEDQTLWYIFESSGFITNLFHKFLEKNIGTKVRNYPWRTCLVSTYHNGHIMKMENSNPGYGEYIYCSRYSSFDRVTLMSGELFYLVD